MGFWDEAAQLEFWTRTLGHTCIYKGTISRQPGAASGWTCLARTASVSTVDGAGSMVGMKRSRVFGTIEVSQCR